MRVGMTTRQSWYDSTDKAAAATRLSATGGVAYQGMLGAILEAGCSRRYLHIAAQQWLCPRHNRLQKYNVPYVSVLNSAKS